MKSNSGSSDSFDGICELFMRKTRREFRGNNAEISPFQLTKLIKRFATAYTLKPENLLDALIRRGWFEASATDTYIIRYDLVRK
jgi:hypothetical protein